MKKNALSVSLLSLLLLVGCGGNSDTEKPTETPSTEARPTENVTETPSTEKPTETTGETIDYGTLTFGFHRVREGYTRKINPHFSNPDYADEVLHYESADPETLTIDDDGTMHGLKAGTVKVTVTSEHFPKTSFYAAVASDSKFNSQVQARYNAYSNKDYPVEGRTLFAGDSFFDTQFWSNFYSSYYGSYNTYTMGISATQAEDWYYYATKLLIPFEPENIVFHLGTNDINDAHLSGEATFSNLESIFEEIHAELPETKIYIFGIEPSTSFSGNLDKEKVCNQLTAEYCAANDFMTYLDSPSMFMNAAGNGADGNLLRDGLHPKLENYTIYDNLLKEAGLTMTKLENQPEEKKNHFITLNTDSDFFVTRDEEETSITVDGITSGQNAIPNRVFYSTDYTNMYKGDLMIQGKVRYEKPSSGNHFLEFYFGQNPGDWQTSTNLQFLLWNENAKVFNVDKGVQNVKKDTDYDFTAILLDNKAYMKFNGYWYYKDLGSASGFSFSAESTSGTISSLSVTTDKASISKVVPASPEYTF